jgi:hypothetical protein
MKPIDTAILFITGFTQPDYRTEGNGLWDWRDEFCEYFYDRRQTWVGIRTWNAKMEEEAKEIIRTGAKRIVVIAYSWGCGRALIDFAKYLQNGWNKKIDLVCLIDPVIYGGILIGKAVNALLSSNAKFKLPENVINFAAWRTLNKPSITSPWGRSVKYDEATQNCINSFVIGAAKSFERNELPEGIYIYDPNITHVNIDNDIRVKKEVFKIVCTFLEQKASPALANAAARIVPNTSTPTPVITDNPKVDDIPPLATK